MICFPPSSPPADSPPPDNDNDDDNDGDHDDDKDDDNDYDNDDDNELKRMYASTQMMCTCRDTNFPPSSTPTWKS